MDTLSKNSPKAHRTMCYRCWRKAHLCLCPYINTIAPQTKIVLLMHPREAKKQKLGTGRLTLASLEDSQMISAINFNDSLSLTKILNDPSLDVHLMYPGVETISLDKLNPQDQWVKERQSSNKRLCLLFLDATWPEAKKMMRLSSSLHNLKLTSFAKSYESKFIIKHQPSLGCLSTIESVYYALTSLKQCKLEKADLACDNLWPAFEQMIKFQIKCAEDPSIHSTRGHKSSKKERPTKIRIRPKKNRLFYWDLETSESGFHHKG